jgi:hypothetical protein
MRLRIRVGFAAVLTAASLSVADADEGRVGAFQCEENGVVTFSDQPCGSNDRAIEIDYDVPSAAEAKSAEARASEEETQGDLYARRITLQREIARSEGRISDLEKQRDAELARLQGSLNENEARITSSIWNQGVATRMQAVTQRYDSDIASERLRLDGLRQRETELGHPSDQP